MNLYKLLGVKKNATTAQIRKAFRTLSKSCHPDMEGGDAEKFKLLSMAHEVLTNPERRERYDKTGRSDPSPVTDERIKLFLKSNLKEIIQNRFSIDYMDVRGQIILNVERGLSQARGQEQELLRLMERTKNMGKRFKKKSKSSNLVQQVLDGEIAQMEGELHNVRNAIELAEASIEALKDYNYEVDPTSEGPLNAGPTTSSSQTASGFRRGGFRTTWAG